MDIEASQQFVIAEYLAIMLGELQHVQPGTGPINMTGRFETCQKEGFKYTHGSLRTRYRLYANLAGNNYKIGKLVRLVTNVFFS
jgi:hypothetical protein